MTVLKHKKLEGNFPLFTRIHEIAFEGKDPKTIVQL
jgi:glycerol-3-phosphate dehydrogenase